MDRPRVIYRVHALQRMFQRDISTSDVESVLQAGELIEDYPDDKPYPSRLLLAQARGAPLHVVAAYNASANEVIIVTVYRPDADRWDPTFRRRIKP